MAMMNSKRKTRLGITALIFFLFSAILITSCSNTRRLCPAYKTPYKVEPMPY